MSSHEARLLNELMINEMSRDEAISAIEKTMSRPDFGFKRSGCCIKFNNNNSLSIRPVCGSNGIVRHYDVGFFFRPWWYTGFSFYPKKK